jgi:hypothetical protein
MVPDDDRHLHLGGSGGAELGMVNRATSIETILASHRVEHDNDEHESLLQYSPAAKARIWRIENG